MGDCGVGESAERDTPGRTLFYVPIIHTQTDMGALRQSVQQLQIQRLGKEGWKRNVDLVEKVWTTIERTIDTLALAYNKVRVYQDGLPVCGREMEIVSDLAKSGSRNHRLLLTLKERGATILGTESAELLVEEYQLIHQALRAVELGRATRTETRQKRQKGSLLRRRDQYIGARISETLMAGETGIVFLGLLHSLEKWLAEDIEVVHLTHHLIDQRMGRR
jgi:hypothetical protein